LFFQFIPTLTEDLVVGWHGMPWEGAGWHGMPWEGARFLAGHFL